MPSSMSVPSHHRQLSTLPNYRLITASLYIVIVILRVD